jgi:sensor histidine kinase YesM
MKYLNEKNLPYLVFKLRKFKGNFIFKVFDLFNYLDVVSYNDGPGQLMISESKFFKKKEFKYLKTSEAIVYLSNMNEKAYNNLFISRTKRYNEFQNIKKQYERNEV